MDEPKKAETGINLDALEAAARAATPGPWEFREADGLCDIAVPDGWLLQSDSESANRRDAQYVAAANPAVVLELVHRLREAEALLSRVRSLTEVEMCECDQIAAAVREEVPHAHS